MALSVPTETGALADRFPYVRVGDGSPPLVVFPGIDDAMFDGTYLAVAGWALRRYFARYVDEFDVLLVSRPRGLPEGHAIADMADDYASALDATVGRAHVLGVSMGGMIAQDLTVRHPDLVERLVLANSGHRIADRDAVRRFEGYAADRDWASIRAELSAAMFSDWRALTYPPLALTVGRLAGPRPAVPADVEVSLSAILSFDSADRLDAVEAPTLVFGGTADPYFPEAVLAATADAVPDARRAFVSGAKHAAFHECKRTFDRRVATFLGD